MKADRKAAQKPVSLALIGAGNRGRGIFGQYALDMPHRARFTAVVEPDPVKRKAFAQAHQIPSERCFAGYTKFFSSRKRRAEALVIATLEDERVKPFVQAVDQGYPVLMEKPLGRNAREVLRVIEAAGRSKHVVMICHQLRYTPAYRTIKRLLDSGRYGEMVAIQHSENVSYEHMAHSFVRGLLNNDRLSPMILSKSCHDMDILCHLTGRRPLRVHSFGGLKYFRRENAPAGAPAYCLDGCPASQKCPYDVLKLYFQPDTDKAYLRQMGVIHSRRQLLTLLKTNRFGRCVFRCDNNVVDHQTTQIDFEGGITASFSMLGHNYHERRMTKISLTNGEIEFDWAQAQVIKSYTFEPREEHVHRPTGGEGSHGGGDKIIMDAFVDAVRAGDSHSVLTPIGTALDSHMLCFAAEESRLTGHVIDLREFEKKSSKSIAL